MKQGKKEIKILLIFMIILFFLPIYCLATSKGKITTETVRMREEPSTESSIITLLSQDYEVEIIEEEDNWYKVKYEEYTGYVFSEYIAIEGENIVDENKYEEETNQEEIGKIETTSEINIEKQVNKQAKVYYLPLIHAEVMEIVEENENVYVIQVINGWTYVKTDTVTGWMRIENLEDKVEEQLENEGQENNLIEENEETIDVEQETSETENTTSVGYINAESVNFRRDADKEADIIDTLMLNTEVEILEEENGWYKVSINGITGYVATTLISNEKVTVTSSRSEETERISETTIETETISDVGVQIVEYAKTFLGYPYVYGGTTPSGFDCSGFVQYVYKNFGYSISRSSSSQAKDGIEVSLENLELGDILIFKAYDDYSKIGHVGLYIGNNQFIHANDEKTGVIITSLSYGKYPERFVCGRRII